MTEEKKSERILSADILKWIIVGLLAFALIIFIFAFGVWVGSERAQFSFRWAENYHRNFGGPPSGFLENFTGKDSMPGHGVFGSVIKIDGNILTIKGQDNIERSVNTTDKTTIKRLNEDQKILDIKINDYVVIIGQPNDVGQIEASFIRIMPPPSVSSSPFR